MHCNVFYVLYLDYHFVISCCDFPRYSKPCLQQQHFQLCITSIHAALNHTALYLERSWLHISVQPVNGVLRFSVLVISFSETLKNFHITITITKHIQMIFALFQTIHRLFFSPYWFKPLPFPHRKLDVLQFCHDIKISQNIEIVLAVRCLTLTVTLQYVCHDCNMIHNHVTTIARQNRR